MLRVLGDKSLGFLGGVIWSLLARRLWKVLRARVFALIEDRESGELRRRAAPMREEASAAYLPNTYEGETAASKAFINDRGLFTLQSGQNIFYQTWMPATGKVKAVIVFFHGFGDHCDFQTALKAKTICSLGNFAAATFDMPGHGRSDGAIADIPDWLEFVDVSREVLVHHLRPIMEKKVSQMCPQPGLKFFGFGESMGGGVLFSLLAREKQLFDGAILVCPMLFISRDMLPPWIIVQIFKYVMVRLIPLWPAAPSKDLSALCNEDPQVRKMFNDGDHMHSRIVVGHAKPRIRTAYQMAFMSGDWMQARLPEFDVPSLIIHGGGDVVCDGRVSEQLFAQMANADKELLRPAGVWHADLFHAGPKHWEATKERFAAVVKWLDKRST